MLYKRINTFFQSKAIVDNCGRRLMMAASPQCGCKGSRVCSLCGPKDVEAEQARLLAVKRVRICPNCVHLDLLSVIDRFSSATLAELRPPMKNVTTLVAFHL
jgi:hypothetical protein